MPELPEMEVYRRHLEAAGAGRRITGVEVGRPASLNVPPEYFALSLTGAQFLGFRRRGKYLVFDLSTGLHLLNHFMLGARIWCGPEAQRPQRTFQVILHLDNGRDLYWINLRLGFLHLLAPNELAARLADLGTDPLADAFTPAHLARLLHGRRGALKNLLVDQRWFPGLGNCYADEICWAAALLPQRAAGGLDGAEQERLYAGLRTTLTAALRLGGYTEDPFGPGDTLSGGYLPHLKVYDRQGEACPRCTAPIALEQHSGRKVFFCPGCQR